MVAAAAFLILIAMERLWPHSPAPLVHLGELGASLWLAGLNPGVLEMVRRAGLDEKLGGERMLFTAHAAIERYQANEPTLIRAT